MNKTNQHISILGCGWLGLALGIHLTKNNFTVQGSVTSANKLDKIHQSGIVPFQIDLNKLDNSILGKFLTADVLIFSVPPSKIDLPQLKYLISQINESVIKHVILISSTGVYADANSIINEDSGLAHLNTTSLPYLVEIAFKQTCLKHLTILQLGGLIGPERHPSNFVTSRKILANPNGRINFIEQQDVISIIEKIVVIEIKGETFICCADQHPTKKEFYTNLCASLNLAKPKFEEVNNDTFKIMDNKKIKRTLNFEFTDITKF